MSLAPHNSSKSRFDLLSLKKNKKKTHCEIATDKEPPIIVLDDSSDDFYPFISAKRGDWKVLSSSPIVLDDSLNSHHDKITFESPTSQAKSPLRIKNNEFNITPEMRKLTINNNSSRPSREGWSPAQDIICVSPKLKTPSKTRELANESLEECSMKEIEDSHLNILDELYGNVWKSIPSLFKKKDIQYDDVEPKKLDFNDSDKENDIFDDAKNFYNDDVVTPKPKIKIKKKLYTELTQDTPEVRKIKKELLNFTEPKPKVNKERLKDKPQTEKKSKRNLNKLLGPDPFEEKRDNLISDNIENNIKNKITKKVFNDETPVHKLSFLASLADSVPTWRCEATALDFKKSYKSKRDQLTRKLFNDFNKKVFNDMLEHDMPVQWDAKLRTTAGKTYNRLIKTSNLTKIRTSSITLSVKVIDGPQRLRDTLIHEMCHSATWIIDNELRAGHGPLWKKWARKALKTYPELVEINRCHDMEIHFKYSYKCSQCGYTVNRHSKSLDITKKCCGYCRGTFELVVNRKNKDGVVVSTPAKRGNGFALFVKENYAAEKVGRTHSEVMRVLGQRYAEVKSKG